MRKTEVIDLANQKGYICLDEIPNVLSRRNIKFTFQDKEGYKYFLTPEALKDKRTKSNAIVSGNNPYSIYNIQKYIQNQGSNTILLSKQWKGEKTKLKLRCEKCGREYETVWYHIFANHKFQCNKCGYANPYNKKSYEESEKICKKHGYHIIDGTYVKAYE